MERKFRIAIAGGGSRYTPGILRMLVNRKERFPISKVVLYDNEAERQEKVGKYGQILMKEYYPECEVVYTTDAKEAFTDIDFVFMQIRAGRLKMREMDEKIAMKHGCIGQETCGPGGFAYGMRSIPAVCKIIEDVRKYSPEAWILNYSNPAAIVAEATKRVFKGDHRIINICDMPIGLLGIYAYVCQKDSKQLEPRYFGFNHFGWFTHIYDKKTGEDLLPYIRKVVSNMPEFDGKGFNIDKSWVETFNFLRTMVKDSDEYLPNNYLQYYLYPKRCFSIEDPNYTRANEVMDGMEKKTFEMLDEVIEKGSLEGTEIGKEQITDGHAGYIVDLAYAIAFNTSEKFIAMCENHGTIPNLPEGAMVEVVCIANGQGVEPLTFGEIGSFYKGLLENQYAYEKLTVDACLEGSYHKAWQALTLNRCVNDMPTAKALLDDYIEANKDYWPELK